MQYITIHYEQCLKTDRNFHVSISTMITTAPPFLPIFAHFFGAKSRRFVTKWTIASLNIYLHIHQVLLRTDRSLRYLPIFLRFSDKHSPVHSRNYAKGRILLYSKASARINRQAVASPASGHVGTCPPPWRLRNFFRYTLKQVVWFGVWFGTMPNS